METIHGLGGSAPDGPTVTTIGVFDGVHRGHEAVLGHVRAEAQRVGARAAVVTFEPHPLEFLAPEKAPCLLTTIDQRLERFEAAGIDLTLVLPFDASVAELTPDDFVRRVLVERLDAKAVLVGEDFRFGHNRAGDVKVLTDLGSHFGFEARAVPLLHDEDGEISSNHIRRRLADSDVHAAAACLGRPYRLAGEVVPGRKRGRDLGFPTANLGPHSRACLPGFGIYAGWWVCDGRSLAGVISVGVRPTFETDGRPIVEIHIFDFDGDLYGRRGEVEFTAYMRPELAFEGAEALRAQIEADATQARNLLYS